MRNLIYFLKEKKRSIVYAIFLFCAFELQIAVLNELGTIRFLAFGVMFGFILIAQLMFGFLFIRKRYTRYEIIQVILPLLRVHLLHQVILPLALYIGLLGFMFFYRLEVISHLIVLLVSVIYFFLFLNIRGIYDRDFELEHMSHGIYNLVKIIIFFLLSVSSIEFVHYHSLPSYLVGVAITIISFSLLSLLLLRHMQFVTRAIITILALSISIGIFAGYLGALVFTTYFNIALYLTIIYYVIASLTHHKSEGSLDAPVILEYSAVSLLSVIILSS